MQLAEYVEGGFHLPQWWSLMSIFGVNNYCDSLCITKMVWEEFTKHILKTKYRYHVLSALLRWEKVRKIAFKRLHSPPRLNNQMNH